MQWLLLNLFSCLINNKQSLGEFILQNQIVDVCCDSFVLSRTENFVRNDLDDLTSHFDEDLIVNIDDINKRGS